MLCGMADVEYMHICDYAFPGQANKPCIIGVFDRITAPSFPAGHPFMSVAIQLRGTAHELVPIKMELGRPNGEVIVGMEGQIAVNEAGGAFINFNLINTQFPEAGRYVVKISSAGKTLTSHSLHLVKTQAPLQSAPPGSTPKQFH
jgi:hypothetical protein